MNVHSDLIFLSFFLILFIIIFKSIRWYPMTETISQIIRNGFETWKSNLGISCINLVWGLIVVMILGIGLASFFIPIFTAPPLNTVFTDPESFNSLTPDEISAMTLDAIGNLSASDFIAPGIFFLICLILIILADFFVTGSLYAMMRDATQNGKCSYGTFLSEGRKNFLRVAVAWIISLIFILIISVIIGFIAGIFFGIVAAIFMADSASPESFFMSPLFTIIQIPVTFVMIVLVYPFSFFIYGVVIEQDQKLSEALKTTFSFIRHNLKDELTLGVIIGCLTGLIMIINLIPIISMFTFLLMGFVVGPLIAFWSVRLYMDRSSMIGMPDAGRSAGNGAGSAGYAGSAGSCCSNDGLNGDDTSCRPETADDGSEKVYVDENGRIVPCGPPDYPELGGYKELKR